VVYSMDEGSGVDTGKLQMIPSQGGREIGRWLREFAGDVPDGAEIVEVGCWLGAGTAELLQGAVDGARVHTYDRWIANDDEVRKAAAQGVELAPGQDTLPTVKEFLEPFTSHRKKPWISAKPRICYHAGSLRKIEWHGLPIGLYVDDATKVDELWAEAMRAFKPHFIEGAVLVLMDYHFDERAGERYGAQKRYMAQRAVEYELIDDRLAGTTAAAFGYRKPIMD